MPTNMTLAIPPSKYNKEQDCKTRGGSQESHEPRLIGDILQEYFSTSNEPLAVAYRSHDEKLKVERTNTSCHGKETED